MASAQPVNQPVEVASAISQEEARRRANFYLIGVLGDALYVKDKDMELSLREGKSVWHGIVMHRGTRKPVGELCMDALTGEGVTWHPYAQKEGQNA